MVTIRKTLSRTRRIKINTTSLPDIGKTISKMEGKLSALKRLARLKKSIASSRARGPVRGRPKQAVTKKRTDIRFDPDVLDGLKAHFGRGWSTRVNDEMRKILAKAGALNT